jgi:hypothetical protein
LGPQTGLYHREAVAKAGAGRGPGGLGKVHEKNEGNEEGGVMRERVVVKVVVKVVVLVAKVGGKVVGV